MGSSLTTRHLQVSTLYKKHHLLFSSSHPVKIRIMSKEQHSYSSLLDRVKFSDNPLLDALFRLLTFSYSGSLRFHTLDPINAIRKNQDYQTGKPATISALAHFRQVKEEELAFIQRAATLSGAAVIGVFSWPTTEDAVWAAKMFWHWSLFLSFFALISSAHQRLLRHLPRSQTGPAATEQKDEFGTAKCFVALSLFLQPPAAEGKERKISAQMLWLWQCPLMLMHFSWVFFIIGYALNLMTPIFHPSQATISRPVAIVTMCGCVLIVLNFALCAAICEIRLFKAGKKNKAVKKDIVAKLNGPNSQGGSSENWC